MILILLPISIVLLYPHTFTTDSDVFIGSVTNERGCDATPMQSEVCWLRSYTASATEIRLGIFAIPVFEEFEKNESGVSSTAIIVLDECPYKSAAKRHELICYKYGANYVTFTLKDLNFCTRFYGPCFFAPFLEPTYNTGLERYS